MFWPSVKGDRVAGKLAVEQPVFIVASAQKPAPAASPAAVMATPVAAPTTDKSGLAQLATAIKTQPAKPATLVAAVARRGSSDGRGASAASAGRS